MYSGRDFTTYKEPVLLANELLQMFRYRAGLSQQEMAGLLGLKSARMICYWEGGHSSPPSRKLKKIIELFLYRGVFLPDQETIEAVQLWQTVKNVFDAQLNKHSTYPDFDKSWFNNLLRDYQLFLIEASSLTASNQLTNPNQSSAQPAPNNLPLQLTSFIGREHEMAEVIRILNITPLLSLCGTGGIGKTRLAIQSANKLINQFKDGVWLIELASISNPELLPMLLAQTLLIQEENDRALLNIVLDYLQNKEILLILDNCEHLIPGCAVMVKTLLNHCSLIHILVTSRQPLGIEGETVWRVPSFSLPATIELASLDDTLAQYDAMQLFIERAMAAQPIFSPTAEAIPTIIEICQQLDGIPLAIELAAARAKILSIEQIAFQLKDRFRLLSKGNRTTLPRHKSLRQAIDWSYELLTGLERLILERLAVFTAGWSLEAAKTICAEAHIQPSEIKILLEELANKSLILVDEPPKNYNDLKGQPDEGEVRYRMLETIRHYARERLIASNELSRFEERHAHYYATLAEKAEVALRGYDQERWLLRLEQEQGNLTAALSWSLQQDIINGVRLAGALWWFWFTRSHISEGQKWLEQLLQQSLYLPPDLKIKILNGAGAMAFSRGNFNRAVLLHEEALSLSRKTNNVWNIAFTLGCLAMQKIYQGDFLEAAKLTEKSLNLARLIKDNWLIIDELLILGNALIHLGEFNRAAILYEESLRLSHALGNRQFIGYSLLYSGSLAIKQGNLRLATLHLEEALCLWKNLKDKRVICEALNELATVAFLQENYTKAESLALESLQISQELQNLQVIAICFINLGNLMIERNDYAQGESYLKQALKLFENIGDKTNISIVVEKLAGLMEYNSQLK